MQVLEWISYHVEKNKYDASSIDFSCCNMDGRALCHCTRDQMRLIFGPLGDELYDRLHEISECPASPQSPGLAAHRVRPRALCQPRAGAQRKAHAGLGSAPLCAEASLIPVPWNPAASDELSWIIELLEKEDADSQETSLDSSHLGTRRATGFSPVPQGVQEGLTLFFISLPPPELGNPCAKDSLEDLKPTNPFLATDFTCLSGAMSPGSSDLSGQCFHRAIEFYLAQSSLCSHRAERAPSVAPFLADAGRRGQSPREAPRAAKSHNLSPVPVPPRARHVPQSQLAGLRWK